MSSTFWVVLYINPFDKVFLLSEEEISRFYSLNIPIKNVSPTPYAVKNGVLTFKEFKKNFETADSHLKTDKNYIEYCKKNGALADSMEYWTRTPGRNLKKVSIVDYTDKINLEGKAVYDMGGAAIRPAIVCNINNIIKNNSFVK